MHRTARRPKDSRRPFMASSSGRHAHVCVLWDVLGHAELLTFAASEIARLMLTPTSLPLAGWWKEEGKRAMCMCMHCGVCACDVCSLLPQGVWGGRRTNTIMHTSSYLYTVTCVNDDTMALRSSL